MNAKFAVIKSVGAFAIGALLIGCGSQNVTGSLPPSSASAAQTPRRTRQSIAYEVLYSFKFRTSDKMNDNDGRHPDAGLTNLGDTFYGTTFYGGTNGCRPEFRRFQRPGCGTVFSITPSGTETVLYRFRDHMRDGAGANSLVNASGILFGTTRYGGTSELGTVFSVTPSGTETVLHSFAGAPADGANPAAALININSTLYGSTGSGGADGDGTVFSIAASGAETVLHSFAGKPSDGSGPSALVNVDGTLYGTTASGGAKDNGTVFSITPSGTETVLYSFKGAPSDGNGPSGPLLDVRGTLYGVTKSGGANNYFGTVYSITPSGMEKVLYSFKGPHKDGSSPCGGLVNGHGTLYGVTCSGGARHYGAVFSITPSGTETILHNFEGGPNGDGADPNGGLLYVNGTLYGTTWKGGTDNSIFGTVFALTP